MRHITKGIIYKAIKLCFPKKKFSARDLNILKKAANSAYRSYREALRVELEKIAVDFIKDLK